MNYFSFSFYSITILIIIPITILPRQLNAGVGEVVFAIVKCMVLKGSHFGSNGGTKRLVGSGNIAPLSLSNEVVLFSTPPVFS